VSVLYSSGLGSRNPLGTRMTNVFMSCHQNTWLDGVESRLAFEFSVYPHQTLETPTDPIARCSDYADANYVNPAMAGPC
jgi:hypothetical protein